MLRASLRSRPVHCHVFVRRFTEVPYGRGRPGRWEERAPSRALTRWESRRDFRFPGQAGLTHHLCTLIPVFSAFPRGVHSSQFHSTRRMCGVKRTIGETLKKPYSTARATSPNLGV